jgi:hypothetical protein
MSTTPATPIYIGSFSPDAVNVALQLARVPTLSELTARLGALPSDALAAAVRAEPEIYKATIAETRDLAAYLQLHAAAFTELAARLEGAGAQ